ncbi:hypothetical protein [Paenibacillus sp. Marseille-Q4541]|uniref:hypothetical protein n=1 Tax=Paenibacillus sp. Marseille-Q4541 TaxID=2831522 RepID=UPI001BAB42E4|nr:hypothetical protein [Paenibacillus sp. Marseille-Q4541]
MKSTTNIAGLFILFIVLSYLLVSCSFASSDSFNRKPYDGRILSIGIVGEVPDVREKHILFQKIHLHQMKEASIGHNLDAIFISKEFLSAAAAPEFAKVYKGAEIPVFFLESERGYVPFYYEGISYEDAPDTFDLTYATALVPESGNEMKYWGFGLNNDKKNKKNIQSAYSDMFQAIDKGSLNNE